MIQAEDACGGEIGAGFPAYSQHPQPVTPAQAKAVIRRVRLQSMVLSELAELIQSVNLGAGTEAAITEGRRRIRQHLAHLTDQQQAYFDALVDEDQLPILSICLRDCCCQLWCRVRPLYLNNRTKTSIIA